MAEEEPAAAWRSFALVLEVRDSRVRDLYITRPSRHLRIEARSGAAAGALVVPAPAARASVGMHAMLAASVILPAQPRALETHTLAHMHDGLLLYSSFMSGQAETQLPIMDDPGPSVPGTI